MSYTFRAPNIPLITSEAALTTVLVDVGPTLERGHGLKMDHSIISLY